MTTEDKDREQFDNLMGFSTNMFSEWNTPDDTYTIPVKHAPMSKQLERVWLLNGTGPASNLIENTGAGGTSYRVSDSPLVSLKDYEDFYFTTFMKEHTNPLKATEALKEKVASVNSPEASALLMKIAGENVLLGGYYVSIAPFKDCNEAKDFFETHNKQAHFIQKESKCTGCVYNKQSKCALMHKYLADEIPYTDNIANAMLKQDVSSGVIDKKTASVLLKIKDPRQRIRKHILAKYVTKQAKQDQPTYMHTNLAQDNVTKDDLKIVKSTIIKLVKSGADYSTIVTKVGAYVGTSLVKQLLPDLVAKVTPVNMAKFAGCTDEFRGKVAMLIKDATCEDCVFNENRTCGKYKVSFVKESKEPVLLDLGKKIKEANLKNKDYVVSFFSKCIDSGVSLSQLKESFTISLGKAETEGYLKEAVLKAKQLDPFKFSRCTGAHYAAVQSVFQGSNCAGCNYNQGSHCASLNKPFVNPSKHASMYPPSSSDLIRPADILKGEEAPSEESLLVQSMFSKGASLRDTLNHFNDRGVSTGIMKQAMVDAVKRMEVVNTATLTDCRATELVKHATHVAHTSKCISCNYNQTTRCAMFSKPFADKPNMKTASVVADDSEMETILFDALNSEYTIDF